MTTMTCPPPDQLKAFYLGQLPDDRSDEFVAHVGTCSHCQAELETVVDADDSLIANLRDPDSGSELDQEPACEMGLLRALGALANANESHAESLPKSIGEYEVLRALGHGGMGHVYLARHSKLGRLVALKILAGHRLGDRRASQRFEAEMRAIGRLSHPNIVTAHDAREIEGTAVLVTEFIDGFDLGHLLQRTGPIAVADACEIIRQVALALQYTSDQGYVHRDVKPSNVMLSAEGEVKLLDLGLARLQFGDAESVDVTGTGQTMGTADYISPEQVTDSRKVDVRSDIYSLGATLFKLLTGRAPFADEKYSTAFAKMTAHVSTTPVTLRSLRSDIPEDLSRFVASMLAKRPEDRPQKPDAIAAKLSFFTEGHNLELLARQAALVNVNQARQDSVSTPSVREPLTQSFWHRPVKFYVAIAAGLFGVLIGFCFGIIITITNPDGTKTVMRLAEGSKAEISQDGSGKGESTNTNRELISGPLLEFGFVVDGTWDPEVLSAARLVPLAEGVDTANPLNREDGVRYAFVSKAAKLSIRADELAGHLIDINSISEGGASRIEMTFDERLAKQMFELTHAGIGRNLAIIAEGKIIAAPRIVAPFGPKAVISGSFTLAQLERIRSWLKTQTTPSSNLHQLSSTFNQLQIPATQAQAAESPEPDATSNLKQLGIAFANFEASYRQLPASKNYREGGIGFKGPRAIHPFSWRVAILPYIEHAELFQQYDFNEPWDSEKNLKLIEKMPAVYRSPFAPTNQKPGETNYFGLVGTSSGVTNDGVRSAMGESVGIPLAQIKDGTSTTGLLVETKHTVPWTKPEDLPFNSEEDVKRVQPLNGRDLNCLMVDGTVLSLKQPIDLERFTQLFTRDGGETITTDK